MKRYYITIAILFCMYVPINAQSTERQVIAGSGKAMSNGSGSLEYTLGETITLTMNNASADKTLTNGFHQGIFTVTDIKNNQPLLGLKVFPNPAKETVYVSFEEPQHNISVELYDMEGRLLQSHQNNLQQLELNLTTFSDGTYYLKVNRTTIYKIVKIH